MPPAPRGQVEDSPATAGLPEAEETVEARGDLQDQAFKWLFALRISLGSRRPAPLAARRRGLWDGAKLTPERPRRMSFTAFSIPALPTFLRRGNAGGLPPPPQPSGRLGASFGTRLCRAGTVDFSNPDPRVISVIAEGAGGGGRAPSEHVADGPGGAVPAVLTPGWGLRLKGQCRRW